MKIIVIADDLTGAAEVAGAALRFGLSAEVQIGQLQDSESEVIVVDANSRSSSADVAAAKVQELTDQACRLLPDVLFKKVDSLLRGAVLAEITSMAAAAGFSECLLVCGNPRKQRTVKDGKIFINGISLHETDFAIDPEHPRHTDVITDLLWLDATSGELSDSVKSRGTRITVGEVGDEFDLRTHARTWFSQRQFTLAAGGAEFFEAVLATCLNANCLEANCLEANCLEASRPERDGNDIAKLDEATLLPDGDILLISGSRLTRCNDWPVVRLDLLQTTAEQAAEVCRTLSSHGRAAIRAVDMVGDLFSDSPAARIEQIADVSSRVLAHCRPAQVWIEGGRTASTLIRELGYKQLVAVANVGDGAVALRSADESSPLYLIKPGSYPWPEQCLPEVSKQCLPEVSKQCLPEVSKQGISEPDAVESRSTQASLALAKKLLLLLAFASLSHKVAAKPPEFSSVAEILIEQCVDCHGVDTQDGTVDLSRFRSLDDVDKDRHLWKTVFDVVEAGQMPLPQSGYELDDTQRETLLEFARHALSRPDPILQAIDPGKPVLRRLNRLEYNNTVRDLFDLEYDIFMFPERLPVADKRYFTHGDQSGVTNNLDSFGLGMVVQTSMREYGQKYDVLLPQLGLPGDNRAAHGYANRGDVLNFSPLLFEKYLEMADAIASSDRLLRDSRVLQELLNVVPSRPAANSKASRIAVPRADLAAREQIGREDRIEQFLARAYRREVTETELDSALHLVSSQTAGGASEVDALRRLVQMVLSSPEFLFLAEPIVATPDSVRRLQPFEIANRLSYFLWSSMPDEELLATAKTGSLKKPEVLRAQLARMLADRSSSKELSESFAVQWLRLDQLYSSKPDRKLFKRFYSGPQGKSTLHGPMMTEALLLFETVLAEDGSILQLYDPEFTWLNNQLAKLYGLEEAFESAYATAAQQGLLPATLPEKSASKYWLRTRLPDRTRGGVLTMAGPLTLTSLPFRTSPIKRGAWLLETVFNRPPSEPKVAFVLEEAVSDEGDRLQTQTVRQLFEKHRDDPNCYSCHSRIDPPGFSLEVFDAMGGLRTHDGEQRVDASGTWNGRGFAGPSEFKDVIRAGEQELVRGFVEHLLSYALGRQLQYFDMSTVDQIVSNTAENGYRISEIIEGIVLSYPFQHVRNQP